MIVLRWAILFALFFSFGVSGSISIALLIAVVIVQEIRIVRLETVVSRWEDDDEDDEDEDEDDDKDEDDDGPDIQYMELDLPYTRINRGHTESRCSSIE